MKRCSIASLKLIWSIRDGASDWMAPLLHTEQVQHKIYMLAGVYGNHDVTKGAVNDVHLT